RHAITFPTWGLLSARVGVGTAHPRGQHQETRCHTEARGVQRNHDVSKQGLTRSGDPRHVVHRTRVPSARGAINLIVQVTEATKETLIDVVAKPSDSAHGDNEATQIRQPLLDRPTDISPPPIVDAQSRPQREPTPTPPRTLEAPVHFGPGGRI